MSDQVRLGNLVETIDWSCLDPVFDCVCEAQELEKDGVISPIKRCLVGSYATIDWDSFAIAYGLLREAINAQKRSDRRLMRGLGSGHKFHYQGVTKTCPHCKKAFLYKGKNPVRKFCSMGCHRGFLAARKNTTPCLVSS